MKKNPFSIYDFLGYVFPGAFAILVFRLICHAGSNISLSALESFVSILKGLSLEDTLWFILASYIVGHVVAYASSLTIEPFSVWRYGYPSSFLLGEKRTYYSLPKDGRWLKLCVLSWKTLVAIFVLPITLCSFTIGDCLHFKAYSLKVLDAYLIDCIIHKSAMLIRKLNLPDLEVEDIDFHRIIYHYEYEKKNVHAVKMDNYVALYGFMRALTFICNCCFLYYVYTVIDRHLYSKIHLIYGIGIMLLTYFFFLAFMKFYRRFTLESFMCLVTDEDL